MNKNHDSKLTKEMLHWMRDNPDSEVYHLIASVYLDYRMNRLYAHEARLQFEGFKQLPEDLEKQLEGEEM